MIEELEQARARTQKCALAPAWSLTDEQLIDALDTAHRVEQAAAAVKLHLIRQIDLRDPEQTRAWRTTASWLRDHLRLDPRTARDLVAQAGAVARHPLVDHALSMGALDQRRAGSVLAALDELPPEVSTATVAAAESMLTGLAEEFAPSQMRRIGARVLEHVAPDEAKRLGKSLLERQERRARRRRAFSLSAPADGQVSLRGTLSVEDAAVVRAALDPLCRPSRSPVASDERTPPQSRADALVEVCNLALRTGELPSSTAGPAQLVVTAPYDVLAGEFGRGHLDAGERISAASVRRLACDAGILPMVLGGAGQPLDVGRARRAFTGALRRAVVTRDRGCAFPDCDRPARWTDVHHIVSWLDGGETSVRNGVLLCRRHHRVVHEGEWTVRAGPDGVPEFVPPRGHALGRTRRNRFHRLT
ncbi:HNH endonuclease signature motif containing protein [Mangrovihabitans endophyticus]|uniref:HNH endonuclease n=1 Tax=Mangrovihabitans endophyticus TaxID=1751298 RepID=A0A8J3FM74_9ACTN|nr:HNH endonuclease signature motif containing protein [Mangrovihabitans endophyticus]GGK70813.1 HNH endonuclease [Mangrovihabitans endophyticus]